MISIPFFGLAIFWFDLKASALQTSDIYKQLTCGNSLGATHVRLQNVTEQRFDATLPLSTRGVPQTHRKL